MKFWLRRIKAEHDREVPPEEALEILRGMVLTQEALDSADGREKAVPEKAVPEKAATDNTEVIGAGLPTEPGTHKLPKSS